MLRIYPQTIYPRSLFHLSPVFRTWVKLSIYDYLHVLHFQPGFEGQDILFYNNHPIQWVCIVGLVVALEELENMHIITLDDGSGEVVNVVLHKVPRHNDPLINLSSIKLHGIVKAKGTISHFRENRQLNLRRVQNINHTDAEVNCWRDTEHFKKNFLSKPWTMPEHLRRLEKRQIGMMSNDLVQPTSQETRESRCFPDKNESIESYRGKRRKSNQGNTVKNVVNEFADVVDAVALIPNAAVVSLGPSTLTPMTPALPNRDPTLQSLKIVVLQHLKNQSIRVFALSQLRSEPVIEEFTTLVLKHNPIPTPHHSAKPLSASAQNSQILLNALRILVQDGNIICKSNSLHSYIVVGRWNLEDLIEEACAKVMTNFGQKRSADVPDAYERWSLEQTSEKEVKIYARNIWLKAKSKGGGWSGVTKGVILDIVTEVLSEREEWMNMGKGIWKLKTEP